VNATITTPVQLTGTGLEGKASVNRTDWARH
jgi:hypothetical protein